MATREMEREPGIAFAHSEMERGVDPEALADIGYSVSPDSELAYEVAPTPEESAEVAIADNRQKEINANARAMYLRQLVQEVGSQRMMEGFAVNHDRTPDDDPGYRSIVEAKNLTKQEDGQETLERACAVCAHAGDCSIKDDLGAWTAYHPYADRDDKAPYTWQQHPEIKRAEGRMKFNRRLAANALAHCIPDQTAPKPKRKRA